MDPLHQGPEFGDVTVLLRAWRGGDGSSLDALVSVAYPQLKRIAEAFLRREITGHTLQATGLVSELYILLLRQRKTSAFESRAHFYAFAAFLMRAILRDWARERRAAKRGGKDAIRVPLSPELAWVDAGSDELLDLDHAMAELEQEQPRKVRLLELTAFLGCTTQEAADLMGISKSTADRELTTARAWLYRKLHGNS